MLQKLCRFPRLIKSTLRSLFIFFSNHKSLVRSTGPLALHTPFGFMNKKNYFEQLSITLNKHLAIISEPNILSFN